MIEHERIAATTAGTRTESIVLVVTLLILTAMSSAAVALQIGRPFDHDEAEYLHAAWLMGEGQRIYRDFMEDHPPFLYQVLLALQPDAVESGADVRQWAIRGRIFAAICGTISVLAAGLAVWRTTGSAGAFAITVAALFGADHTWLRGLAELRADAPTLALFLGGLVLLIWEEIPSQRMAWLVGSGIALAIAAEIWNPKWPVEGLCLGVFFLIQFARLVRVRRSYAVGAVLPGVIVVIVAYLALTSVTTVRDYLFFNFFLKSQNLGGLETQAWMAGYFAALKPTHFAPPRFAGPAALCVFAVGAASLVWQWRRMATGEARRWVLMIALVIAAVIEVRFVYPWPNLWPQFFLMLAYTMAMVYGLAAAGAIRVAARVPKIALFGIALLLAVPSLASRMKNEHPKGNSASWAALAALHERLDAGDTVWVSPHRHPIVARDASYFWYSFPDLVSMTLARIDANPALGEYLPKVTARDIPLCQLARGELPSLRFVEIGPYVMYIPGACDCAMTVLARPDIVASPSPAVWEVLRPGTRPMPGLGEWNEAAIRGYITAVCSQRR